MMLIDYVVWGERGYHVEHVEPRDAAGDPIMLPSVYVVVMSQWSSGDVAGVSVSNDTGYFSHLSSDVYWLLNDTTVGFGGERRARFRHDFPNGFKRVLVDLRKDDMPLEIEHHFTKAGDDAHDDEVPHPAEAGAEADPRDVRSEVG